MQKAKILRTVILDSILWLSGALCGYYIIRDSAHQGIPKQTTLVIKDPINKCLIYGDGSGDVPNLCQEMDKITELLLQAQHIINTHALNYSLVASPEGRIWWDHHVLIYNTRTAR